MGEYGFNPMSEKQEKSRITEIAPPAEKISGSELIINISEKDLQESQSGFAIGRGFKDFENMPPLERAEFWAVEGGVADNYLEAEKAAKEAGLDRPAQLEYKKRALEARMSALSHSADKGDIREFQSLDQISGQIKQELAGKHS